MAVIIGGLRARLIRDSVYMAVRDGLEALGWFDPNAKIHPITLTAEPLENDQLVKPNTMTVTDLDAADSEFEMGSSGIEKVTEMAVNLYAESAVVGRHLIHDVRDILGGRAGGRTTTVTPIMRYDLADPVPSFAVDIENIEVMRPSQAYKPHEKFWFVCRFDVVDSYYGDGEGLPPDYVCDDSIVDGGGPSTIYDDIFDGGGP